MSNHEMPTYQDIMNPTLQALRELGGSATNTELYNKVIVIMKLPDDVLNVIHDPDKGTQTEVYYRLAWAKSYLKKYGLVDNLERSVWSLTKKGREVDEVDPQEVTQFWRDIKRKEREQDDLDTPDEEETIWQEELLETLLKMDPDAFERLVQRILRESGFIQVEVTGKTGDGGIDGKGIMRLSKLLSFHVLFQCKRYQGSVSVSKIRDFRGAMVGRADKGIFITTGNYTQDALQEATRDGASPIDLIDGDGLIELLKDLELGIKTKKITTEEVNIDHDWFMSI